MLLGLTLLHTYHLFAFFITYWYGRLEVEQAILNYLMFDSYIGIFWAQLFFTFFIPFPILVSNHARREGWGAPLAAIFIVIGLMLWHIRIFAAALAPRRRLRADCTTCRPTPSPSRRCCCRFPAQPSPTCGTSS